MKAITAEFLKIGAIAGMWYHHEKVQSRRIVIYGMGAPLPPDNGSHPDACVVSRFETDVFVPDYIGYGRSDGIFTPTNCIKTFLKLNIAFQKGCRAQNQYLAKEKYVRYQEIIFIGRSFGGAYISLLPRFNSSIQKICLIFPILDYVACGKIPGEETVRGFMQAMNNDGYKYLYRGINRKVWQKHFTNLDGLCPMQNSKFLVNTQLFLGHGKNDTNINILHSQKYAKLLQKNGCRVEFKTYSGAHNNKTSKKIILNYMQSLKVPLREYG